MTPAAQNYVVVALEVVPSVWLDVL
jgi:hypothetical protein